MSQTGGRFLFPLFCGFIIGCCIHLLLFEWNSEGTVTCDGLSQTDSSEGDSSVHASKTAANPVPNTQEDFELKYMPAPSQNMKEPESRKKIVRPRFLAVEVDMKDKLLVGILTSPSMLSALGVAANRTIAHHVSKFLLFTEGKEPMSSNLDRNLNLVTLDSLQPLAALAYVGNHYGNNYDWIYLAKDTTYVRAVKLFEIVSHMSAGYDVVLGSDDVCSMDAGVLFSRGALLRLSAAMPACLPDEQNNAGLPRCLAAAGLSCGRSFGGSDRSLVAFTPTPHESILDALSAKRDVSRVTSVGPVTSGEQLHQVHKFFTRLEMTHVQDQLEALESEVDNGLKAGTLPPDDQGHWPYSVQPHLRAKNRWEVIPWDLFTLDRVYEGSSTENSRPPTEIEKEDFSEVIQTAMREIAKENSQKFTLERLVSGYRRFDPMRGMEYLLDLQLLPGSIHQRVELIRPLNRPEIIPVPYVTEAVQLSIILPITSGKDTLAAAEFLDSYASARLAPSDSTRLLIFVSYAHDEEFASALSRLQRNVDAYRVRYAHRLDVEHGPRLELLRTDNPVVGPLTVALETAFGRWGEDSMYYVASPRQTIKSDLLNRIRMNTIKEFQVFSAVPFRQFNPELSGKGPRKEVHKDHGYFDTNEHGFLSFYGSDYTKCKSIADNRQGSVDDILSIFINCDGRVHILRAPDPSLFVAFDPEACADGQDHCLDGMGTKAQLYKYVSSNNA